MKYYKFMNNPLVYQELKELYKTTNLREEHKYRQHQKQTTLSHSVNVACMSQKMAVKMHLNVDQRSLVRGALLHDYFLYDWHTHSHEGMHGTKHPCIALTNASKDTSINAIERDVIRKHMFPLTITPPRYKEAWIVCVADKVCATGEIWQGMYHRISRRKKK